MHRMRRRFRPLTLTIATAALVAFTFATTPLRAQPLGDRVPSDAVVYVAWQGSQHLGASYEQSHLKALLDASNLDALFTQFLPELLNKAGQQDPQVAQHLRVLQPLLAPAWKYPTAVFYAGVDFMPVSGPLPKLGLICRAGDESPQLLQRINALLQNPGGQRFRAVHAGDAVIVTVGYDDPAGALAGGNDRVQPITAQPRFRDALAKVQREPAAIVYLDVEALVAFVDGRAKLDPQFNWAKEWNRLRDALGLDSVKRLVWTGAFADRQWETRAYLHAPAPRKGLVAWLDTPPVSEAALKSVPKTATWVKACVLDLGNLLTGIRTLAGQFDPEAPKAIDMGLGAVQAATTVDLQAHLFQALGNEWLLFTDPQAGGKGFGSLMLVNPLRKPADAERALKRLELFLDNAANGQLRRDRMRLTFGAVRAADAEVHYVGLPFVSPAWAIKDGKLYAALYPQVLASALSQPPAPGNTLLDNPTYAAMRKRLAAGADNANATSISFMNLPETAGESYQSLLSMAQFALGAADMNGINTPPMLIPPLHVLRKELTPAGSVSWTDDTGWHYRSASPFPGASLVGSEQSVVVGSSALGLSIVLPALNAAKERANRVKSASNLRQIAQGVLLFANDNRGRYPNDLGTLLLKADLNIEVFVDPSSDTSIPAHLRNAPLEQQAAWVNANSDFVYLGHRLNSASPADRVLAYSKLEAHANEGMNIVFNDGHVEWFTRDAALKVLERDEAEANKKR